MTRNQAAVRHPLFARGYARMAAKAENKGAAEHRTELLAELTGRVIEVGAGIAGDLPADDASFDAGIASLVLCSVSDQDRALAELWRVIRPGGELRFYEHIRADTPGFARLQRGIDLVWPFLGGGCHTSRDTTTAIERAGFDILTSRRFRFVPCWIAGPVAPHIVGTARRGER